MKAPIFLCCPTLTGLLGLCVCSKFSSFRIMLLICPACLVQLQSACTCGHVQNFQVSADYQVKLPQDQKSCTSSDNLRNVLGQKNLAGQGGHGSRLCVRTSHVKCLWLLFSFSPSFQGTDIFLPSYSLICQGCSPESIFEVCYCLKIKTVGPNYCALQN